MADEVAEASGRNRAEAKLLGVRGKSRYFVSRGRLTFTVGKPVEFVKSTYRGDRCKS